MDYPSTLVVLSIHTKYFTDSYRKDHNLKVSGQEIYEAVLENGMTDPEECFNTHTKLGH